MAGVAAQEIRVPLKTGFLHDGQALGSLKACWGGRSEFENGFLNIDPITMAYSLNSRAQEQLTSIGTYPEHPENPGALGVGRGDWQPRGSLSPSAVF